MQPCHVVYTDYRPTPLQHYIFPAGGDGLHLVVDENVSQTSPQTPDVLSVKYSVKLWLCIRSASVFLTGWRVVFPNPTPSFSVSWALFGLYVNIRLKWSDHQWTTETWSFVPGVLKASWLITFGYLVTNKVVKSATPLIQIQITSQSPALTNPAS